MLRKTQWRLWWEFKVHSNQWEWKSVPGSPCDSLPIQPTQSWSGSLYVGLSHHKFFCEIYYLLRPTEYSLANDYLCFQPITLRTVKTGPLDLWYHSSGEQTDTSFIEIQLHLLTEDMSIWVCMYKTNSFWLGTDNLRQTAKVSKTVWEKEGNRMPISIIDKARIQHHL